MDKRWHSFKCISYLDYETLCEKLASEQINHWAFAYHDKDIKEDGSDLKEAHFHVLCVFRGNKSIEACRRFFEEGSEQNTLAKPMEDLEHDFRYLIHKDDLDKYQYDKETIVTDGTKFWERVDKEIVKKGKPSDEELVDDLLAETIDIETLGRKYGRDFMKNLERYQYFREQVLNQRAVKKLTEYHLEQRRKQNAMLNQEKREEFITYEGQQEILF